MSSQVTAADPTVPNLVCGKHERLPHETLDGVRKWFELQPNAHLEDFGQPSRVGTQGDVDVLGEARTAVEQDGLRR